MSSTDAPTLPLSDSTGSPLDATADAAPTTDATSAPEPVCAACGAPASIGCGQCQHEFYCSEKCLDDHRPGHEAACKEFSTKGNQLAGEMINFVLNEIIGAERGMYRTIVPMYGSDPLKDNDRWGALFAEFHVQYFNRAYRSLILRDDEFLNDAFDKMRSHLGHSHICLLNTLVNVILSTHQAVPRDNLDTTSLDSYTHSVHDHLTRILEQSAEKIRRHVSHDCTGDDIATCDPDEVLFSLEIRGRDG